VLGKFYFGDDAKTVKEKMQAKMPDLERIKENEKIDGVVVPIIRDVVNCMQ